MGKTISAVHSDWQMRDHRLQAACRDKNRLNALSVYAHLRAGFSLYLYGHVSTPGYLSTMLTVPVLLLFFLLARFLVRRKKPGLPVIVSAPGPCGAKFFLLCFSLLNLLDAQLIFFTLCAVARDVMPDFDRTIVALATALFCALSGGDQNSLSRLSRPLKWLAGALLTYCVIIAVPHGKASHFFPLLGYGPSSILRGALWMSGAAASAVWPVLTCEDGECSRGFFSALRSPLIAVGLGIVIYLTGVWLMPVYAMQRPESLGWRMLLIVHMTPSVPAWSMEVTGLLLLLLAAAVYSVSNAAWALSHAGGKSKAPRFLNAALLFLLIPACVIDPDAAQEALSAAAPWRSAAVFALLCALFLCSLIREKRKAGVPEDPL